MIRTILNARKGLNDTILGQLDKGLMLTAPNCHNHQYPNEVTTEKTVATRIQSMLSDITRSNFSDNRDVRLQNG